MKKMYFLKDRKEAVIDRLTYMSKHRQEYLQDKEHGMITLQFKQGMPVIRFSSGNTNYFPIDKLFYIKSFYDKNFTEFCENQCHVPFLFDLLVGSTYQDACTLTQIDENTIELNGNAFSINKILSKIDNESSLKIKTDIDRNNIIPEYIVNPIQRFIIEKGTSVIMDISNYTVKLTKLN